MAYDVFISYSRKDTAIADKICKTFDSVGITYFIDRQGIGGGFEFPEVLANAILDSKIVLYLASENSYKSKFTNSELTFAFNEKPKNSILPYIIDGSNMPSALRFVFSSINWRTKETHPIETVLLKDILLLLGKSEAEIKTLLQNIVRDEELERKHKAEEQKRKEAERIRIEEERKKEEARKLNNHNGHEYVDLGLPSGLKWATCNVGAIKPEEYGDYFAWGETTPKQSYEKSNYKWYKKSFFGVVYKRTKYKDERESLLEYTDDAARVNWGGKWRMPTRAEQDELRTHCTWEWTALNGIEGHKVTSKKNGNSIFLPAAGYRNGSDFYGAGSYGSICSSSLNTNYSSSVCWLLFDSSGVKCYSGDFSGDLRYCGHSVRPVCE